MAGRYKEASATGLCAEAHGFSLHAAVRCGAHQREELERLCRYIGNDERWISIATENTRRIIKEPIHEQHSEGACTPGDILSRNDAGSGR